MEKEPYQPEENEIDTFDINDVKQNFINDYQRYRSLRRKLHENGSLEDKEELQIIKDKLSQAIKTVYEYSGKQDLDQLDFFEENLKELLSLSGNIPINEIDDYILGAYIYPENLDEEGHSIVESIYSTLENYKIVSEFKKSCEPYASGMILTGANSHGAFFSVTGKTPETLTNLGMEQKTDDQFSDIDLVMIYDNSDLLIENCQKLIEMGLIPEEERERLKTATDMFKNNQIDVFSIRTHYKDIEQSLHMIPKDTIDKMVNFEEPKKDLENSIGYLLDFRPNLPTKGGYLIKDIKGINSQGIFLEPVVSPVNKDDNLIDYVSHSPTGGFSHNTYYIGPFSFFLQIHPTILFDKKGQLKEGITHMRRKIQKVLGSDPLNYIPRQENMSQSVLNSVRKDFQANEQETWS